MFSVSQDYGNSLDFSVDNEVGFLLDILSNNATRRSTFYVVADKIEFNFQTEGNQSILSLDSDGLTLNSENIKLERDLSQDNTVTKGLARGLDKELVEFDIPDIGGLETALNLKANDADVVHKNSTEETKTGRLNVDQFTYKRGVSRADENFNNIDQAGFYIGSEALNAPGVDFYYIKVKK